MNNNLQPNWYFRFVPPGWLYRPSIYYFQAQSPYFLTNMRFTYLLFTVLYSCCRLSPKLTMKSHLSANETMHLARTFQRTNYNCKQTYLVPSVSLLIDKYWREIKFFSILCPLTVRAGNHMNQSHLETCGRRQAVICTGCFWFHFWLVERVAWDFLANQIF